MRSGKSRFAAFSARLLGGAVTYVATAARDANDLEWTARIEHHRANRPHQWLTIETGGRSDREMYELLQHADRESVLIVDSLGTWLADQMQQVHSDWSAPDGSEALIIRGKSFADAAAASPAEIIVVSEETGWGIVPENAVARVFRDAVGFTNQRLAKVAQRAYLVVCGHAIDLKSALPVGDFE